MPRLVQVGLLLYYLFISFCPQPSSFWMTSANRSSTFDGRALQGFRAVLLPRRPQCRDVPEELDQAFPGLLVRTAAVATRQTKDCDLHCRRWLNLLTQTPTCWLRGLRVVFCVAACSFLTHEADARSMLQLIYVNAKSADPGGRRGSLLPKTKNSLSYIQFLEVSVL